MDDVEVLLAELRDSPTDLARLVTEVLRRQPGTLCVARQSAAASNVLDPTAWTKVTNWLDSRGVRLEILESPEDRSKRC